MILHVVSRAILVSVMLFGSFHVLANELGATAPQKAASKPNTKVKLVDINSANKAALMKLPGIAAADADKIIANRPFGSKTWLVTQGILDPVRFDAIKPIIEARQPYKSAEQNAAIYNKLKQP